MKNKFNHENLSKFTKLLPVLEANLYARNVLCLTVEKNNLFMTLLFLKNHTNLQFKMLTCISGVDYPKSKKRFKIVYELLSFRHNTRLRVAVFSDEIYPITSAVKVFNAAGWYESEIWDMLGVFFFDHPHLTRLLTDYGFEGFPLRKDFPITGFVESSYAYTEKRVLNSKISLDQGLKSFNYESPWENVGD